MEKTIVIIHCMRKIYFQLKKIKDSFVSKTQKQREAKHPSLNRFALDRLCKDIHHFTFLSYHLCYICSTMFKPFKCFFNISHSKGH